MQQRPTHLKLAALAFACAAPAAADHIEELVVTASHDTRVIDVTDAFSIAPDVTQLLKKAPGANVNSNGPITGIPQYRGMFGARVSTALDGMQLAPSGPNWMDPPLSYAVGGQLDSLELYRGIVPVSVAAEAIGGAVDARSSHGDFAGAGERRLEGRVIGSAATVNDAFNVNTALFAASDTQRLKLAAMAESGDDAEFPGGDVTPTEYERQRYDVGYGLRAGNHTLQLDYGYNDTGDSGTPALPMDIETIEGDLYRIGYTHDSDTQLRTQAALFASDLDHTMTNFELRSAPAPAMWRRNTASSDNLGFELVTQFAATQGSGWTFGVDGFSESHDSDIDNPNNPMFFVENFNDARREILGLFVERRQALGTDTRAEFGLRYNRVEMDADRVDATPARMMPPAQALRDAFNSADRERSDDNFDVTARAWMELSERSSLYIGAARRTRSPSYQERYLWLPLEATAGLADGNLYTGNIELDPEVSRQIEFGLDYSDQRLTLSPRVFYNNVKDYIQGTPSQDSAAVMLVRMMNSMNGTNNADPLQFNNVDAILYGFDMDWLLRLDEHWTLGGIVNYVRGQRDDSNDDLYRIAPPNTSLRITYQSARWGAELEGIAYAEQDDVSATNREQSSDGYALVNLLTTWQATDKLQFAAGVDNLFDKKYRPHLGGYNRAANPDIERGERLPAYGANVFARFMYNF